MSTFGLMLLLFLGIGTSVNALNDLNQQELHTLPLVDGSLQFYGSDADLCTECEQILDELKKIVNNPELEKKVVGTLKAICNILKPIKDQCLTRVDYLVNLLHELQALLENPRKTCESLNLCKEETKSLMSALSFFSDIASELDAGKTSDCKFCKVVVSQARKLLDSPVVLGTVKTLMTQSCRIVSDPAKAEECVTDMEALFDKFVPILKEVLDNPEGVCASFHFCDSGVASFVTETYPHLEGLLEKFTSSQMLFKIDIKCTACTTSVAALLKLIKTDKVAGGLADEITKLVCNIFPKTLKAGCFDFLGLYGKPSIVLTASEWTPTEICQALKACKKNNFVDVATNGKVTCTACNAVTSILSYELQQKELQQDVINWFNSVCRVLPDKTNSLRCQTFSETFLPYIMTDIFALSLVPEICPALKLCP